MAQIVRPTKPPTLMLAIDPGVNVGYCYFKKGVVWKKGIISGMDNFMGWLQEQWNPDFPVNQIVLEEFRLYKWKALQQSGSDMVTSQVEGMVRIWARMHNIPLEIQRPTEALPLGKLYSQVPMPRDHKKSHDISALYHGTYWLVKNGMRRI